MSTTNVPGENVPFSLDQFYENSLQHLRDESDLGLVNHYNRETSHTGWTGTRGAYLRALGDAMEERGFDLSEIKKNGGTSYKFPVYFDRRSKRLMPITLRYQP